LRLAIGDFRLGETELMPHALIANCPGEALEINSLEIFGT
jgi:hypothetical protein